MGDHVRENEMIWSGYITELQDCMCGFQQLKQTRIALDTVDARMDWKTCSAFASVRKLAVARNILSDNV